MGCCGCSLRSTTIFAAILSLLQGSAWIGLSIYGLQLYNCNITPDLAGTINLDNGLTDAIANVFTNIAYLEYFYNVDCLVERPQISTVNAPNIKWSDVTQSVVTRTYSWMLTYTILSSLWIAASIVLLIIAVGNKKGKGIAALHYPWISVMAAITIADVVATVTYFLDIDKSMGLKPLLQFMGVEGLPDEWAPSNSNPEDVITTIPAIAMGVLFARFFIFWFINTILLVYVWISAVDIAKVESAKTGWQRVQDPKTTDSRPVSGTPKPWLVNPHESDDKSKTNNQQQPRIHPYVIPEQPQSYQNQGFVSDDPQQMPAGDQIRRFTPAYYQQQQNHQQNNQQQKNPPQHNQQHLMQREPTRDSKRANQGNSTGILRHESIDSRKSSAPVELRSQLPWSYLQPRDDPRAVRQSQMQTFEEDEDLPPIPVPDYTLHFPKRPRGEQNMSFQAPPISKSPVKLTQPSRTNNYHQ